MYLQKIYTKIKINLMLIKFKLNLKSNTFSSLRKPCKNVVQRKFKQKNKRPRYNYIKKFNKKLNGNSKIPNIFTFNIYKTLKYNIIIIIIII